MKHPFLVTLIASLSLSSCVSYQNFYQVCEVDSSLDSNANGNFEYKDKACSVTYNFWDEGGNPGFAFTNNTDQVIYLDLAKSFFLNNGVAYDYYRQRTYTASSSYMKSASASRSLSAQGEWTTLSGTPIAPGSASAGVQASEAAATSSSIEFAEKQIIAIPPHSTKVVAEYCISPNHFYECGQLTNPKPKEQPTYQYQKENTPIIFGNYLTYTIGDDPTPHVVRNDFYIKQVWFYHPNAMIAKQSVGCPNEDQHMQEFYRDASPKKFFIKFTKAVKPQKSTARP